MKILITTEWYTPVINGVVTSVVNLQKELQKLGHEVRIITLSENKKSFQKDGVTYISSIGAGKIYPGARLALSTDNKYLKELAKWHPDVIHSQCEFSTLLIARQIAKKLHIPIVHTYHTVYEDYTHYFSPNEKWGKAMASLFTKKILNNTKCVIAPTEKVRSLLIGYGVKQRIQVVPTGIDLKRFELQIGNVQKQKQREKIGIPVGNNVLIYVGRLAKEKNLEEIFSFMARLNNPKLSLLMVGDGPHRQALEKYAQNLDISKNVVFTGMISPQDIATYYQLGDIFVSASNSETQGLTYIEALANGIPALCRKDACLDHVVEDGINGWQYTSFEQFVAMLDYILNEEGQYKRLCENARAGAIRNFSSSVFAKKVEQIYLDTISQHQKDEKYSHVLGSVNRTGMKA